MRIQADGLSWSFQRMNPFISIGFDHSVRVDDPRTTDATNGKIASTWIVGGAVVG